MIVVALLTGWWLWWSEVPFAQALLLEKDLVTLPTLCMNGLHTHGRWVYNASTSLVKSFVCCGYDRDEDFKWNNATCLPRGAQNVDYMFGYAAPMLSLAGGHSCFCDGELGRQKVHKRERYEWVPDHCELVRFDGKHFCSLLGKEKVVFIGDSTLQQQAVNLMNHITGTGGTCAPQIGLFKTYNPVVPSYGTDWADMMRESKARIVIMGHGPHFNSVREYVSMWELMVKHYESHHVSDYIKAHNVTVLVRTINYGHPHCNANASVLNDPVSIVPHSADDVYSWRLFPVFDDIARRYAVKLGFQMIDVSPLRLRPDAHPAGRDCLHYCLPGPLNLFDEILTTMIASGEIKITP